MDVMNGSLWHAVQHFEQLATLHGCFVFEVVMNSPVQELVISDLFTSIANQLVGGSLSIGERCLQAITEVELILLLHQSSSGSFVLIHHFLGGG